MEDKIIMSTILNNVKGACDLLLHATIESATPDVHGRFKTELDNMLTLQSDIYKKMSEKGWYPTQNVEQQKIDEVKNKFSNK